ncbi:MAG: phospholipid carrier-dependent glycosyltransferase [Planctomycetes bacterium]|nr:phospholipid carrier-dependent glycosyltransferase [Planctomycetota bacterium]
MPTLRISLAAAFRRQLPRIAIALAALLLSWRALPDLPPPGWDEAEHLGLPAVILWEHLRRGELAAAAHALLGQEQYPPGASLAILPVLAVAGTDPAGARAGVVLLFGLLSLLVGAIADHLAGSRETTRAGWIAQGLVLASPAAVALGRSLFLEVPFAVIAAVGMLLYVKLERRELEGLPPGRPRRTLVYLLPGLFFAWACFTKWSYGALLGAALLLERGAAMWVARAAPRRSLGASAWLLAPLVLGALWWFVWPWPGELSAVARAHRFAWVSYLGEARAPGVDLEGLALYAGWHHHLSPAVLAGVCGLSMGAAAHRARSGLRFVALLAALLLGSAIAHPFKLSRLLLPGLVCLWILAGVGFHAATQRWRTPLKAFGVLSAAFLALLSASAGLLSPERLGLRPASETVLAGWRELYASRGIEASGPEGLPALAERLAARLPAERDRGLRVARTGHELSDAALAWALHCARAAEESDARPLTRADYERFDLQRLGTAPSVPASEISALARQWLGSASALLLLDPGAGSQHAFRLEDAHFAAAWRDALRAELLPAGFRLAWQEPGFAFSRRRDTVAVELWIRASHAE